MATKVKAGRIILVENKNQHFAAKDQYLSIWVEDADGSNERCLLFTERELNIAEERAKKNSEDIPEKGVITDFFD